MNGLQCALDGKIYGISWFGVPTGYMSVINNPNEAGLACGFQDSAVYLDGRIGYEALPLFMSLLFKTNFSADSVCVGNAASFKINFHFIDSVQWNFGDPASGAANTSTLVNPTHVYSAAGNFTVTLIAQNGVKSDTVIKTITVKEAPQIDLGPDRDLCLTNPDSVKLGLGGQRGVYSWSTGSVDSVEFVTTSSWPLSGTSASLSVRVRVTLKSCRILDSVLVFERGDCYDGCTPTFANIFTPNADGQNDQFSSELDCETENYHLSIFNRWGALVFESTHQNLTWDGSVNGIPASNGVYYYVLSYQPTGQAQREYRGYVQLME
jgi:gliding motility-associated-like protein